jgi:hypothetical protein
MDARLDPAKFAGPLPRMKTCRSSKVGPERAYTRSRRFRPAIAMMKTSQSRRRDEVTATWWAGFDYPFGRSALVQANVSPVLMIVGNVFAAKPPKMIFV